MLSPWGQTMLILNEVAEEREGQRSSWSLPHDDQHSGGELAQAAAVYAVRGTGVLDEVVVDDVYNHGGHPGGLWPFTDPPKDHDKRRSLVVAAALIVAEIERLDRLGRE